MKQIKRIMIVVLALVLAVSLSLTAFAATASQDGLELSVTTDKTSYSATEQVTVTVTVKNTNAFAVSNVAVESNVPDGYKPADGYSSTKNIATLGAGETATLTVVYVPQSSGQPSGPSYPTYPPYPWYSGNTSNTSDAEETEEVVEIDQPTEGNTNVFEEVTVTAKCNIGFWVLTAVVSAGALIAVLAGKKRLKKTMSIMLCIAMVGTLAAVLPVEANAAVMPIEAGGTKNLSADTTITVDGKSVSIYAKVTWNKETVFCNISFVDDDLTINTQTVEQGGLVSRISDPEKEGYTFTGWIDQEGYIFEFDESVEKDLVLYADWVETLPSSPEDIQELLNPVVPGTTSTHIEGSPITDVTVSYDLFGLGTVSIEPVYSGPLNQIPGLLGYPMEINALGNDVINATISFAYDPASLGENSPYDLGIVWYDEENNIVTLLDNTVVDTSACTISVITNHFSNYAVILRNVWDQMWNTQLPAIRTEVMPYYNVIMAIDCSGSMSGSKMQKSIEAAQNLIDILADDDIISVISFADYSKELIKQAKIVSTSDTGEIIDNRQQIKDTIAKIRASGGTDIEDALWKCIDNNIIDSQYQSFVILISDGQSSVSDNVLAQLKANGQKVISVGIGYDVDAYLMQRIADSTDGSYMFCENATDLMDAFVDLQNAYIGSTTDSDGDGLSDLVETTGMRDQYGNIWRTDPNTPDTDNDGYNDLEEMGKYNPFALHPYFMRVSRPDLYTVKSDEAYLLMPDGYSIDYGNNRISLVTFVTDGGYRTAPDLFTPMEEDGIPKEYIYSKPQNLKVELIQIPEGFTIESIETVEEGTHGFATYYKTTAVLSYTHTTDLDSVTWRVTADNCSEWTGMHSIGIMVKYGEANQNVHENNVKDKLLKNNQLDEAQKNLKIAAQQIYQSLYHQVSTHKEQLAKKEQDAYAEIKERLTLAYPERDKTIKRQVYEAVAKAVYNVLESSKESVIEKYETDPNKLSEQVCKQILAGLKEIDEIVEVDNNRYRVKGPLWCINNLGASVLTVTLPDGYQQGLIWQNIHDEDGKIAENAQQALAKYCSALAQLNNDVWKEFMAYYLSDASKLIGFDVDKKSTQEVLDYIEKTIKALSDKEAANELLEEIGKEIGDKVGKDIVEKLKSKTGWFSGDNKFASFVENTIYETDSNGKKLSPNGKNIIKVAKKYNEIIKYGKGVFGEDGTFAKLRNAYFDFLDDPNNDSLERKLLAVYEQFNTSFNDLEKDISKELNLS